MTYKQRETMREIRLWVGQVIIPAIAVVTTVAVSPEIRESFVQNMRQIKSNIFNKYEKEP